MLLFGRVLGHITIQICSIPLEGYQQVIVEDKPEEKEGFNICQEYYFNEDERVRIRWVYREIEPEIDD